MYFQQITNAVALKARQVDNSPIAVTSVRHSGHPAW